MTSPRSQPPDLPTTTAVAELVGLGLKELNWWAYACPESKRYRRFEIAKANGGRRIIRAPIAPIKRIQRAFAGPFTTAYRPPPHVHGFTPGRSPITNADVHAGQRWVFAVDIAGFFEAITFGRVRGLFEAHPFNYSRPVAELLARLCTQREVLPQGAPTSPIITNYICRSMDRDLAALAISNRALYSRYADDIVFSTDRPTFPERIATHNMKGIAEPSGELTSIIAGAGFRLNEKKTRLQVASTRQRVTGLVVNERVNVPRDYTRGLRAVLHIWRKYGKEEASKSLKRASPDPNWPPDKPYPGLAVVVRGRVDWVGAVRGRGDRVYLGLVKRLRDLDPTISLPVSTPTSGHPARIFTEGPTDAKHLMAALTHFHAGGEFTDLVLEIDEESGQGSASALRDHLKALVDYGIEGLAIGVFDWDTKVGKEVVGPDRWQALGDRVAAVGLARPGPWREELEDLCIELLYEDSVLETKDGEGRRVYRAAEFNPTTSIHRSEKCVIPHAAGGKSKHLIADQVFGVEGNTQLARSKMAFARAIENEPEAFPTLSFEGFRPTFEKISNALGELKP